MCDVLGGHAQNREYKDMGNDEEEMEDKKKGKKYKGRRW